MAKLVVGCIVVFVVALVFLIVSSGHDLTPILDAYRSEPLPQKLAWVVLVLVPVVLLPASVWLSDALGRQRKASTALELRLDGVRKGATELAKSQADADATLRQLARTDPEDAITAVGFSHGIELLGDSNGNPGIYRDMLTLTTLLRSVPAVKGIIQ